MEDRPLILLVDDDSSGRRLLQIILQGAGYRIEQAESGEDALQQIAESLPDLVILDDMLPGIWGDEVCERLKANPMTEHIKVIMYTGRHDKVEYFRQNPHIAAVLSKPTHPREILSTIKTSLDP